MAGVVGALALCETVLPRAFAAMRRWRRNQVRAKTAERKTTVGGVVPNAPQPVSNADSLGGGCDAQGTAHSTSHADPIGRSAPEAEKRPIPQSLHPRSDDANRLWEEAREMPHNFIPDPKTDGDYLSKVYTAARLGHLEAMAKLGEYAYRRGTVVETYYWTLLAELKGAKGLGAALRKMRAQWVAAGCPPEYENTYGGFTEEQGVFARAVLRLQCGVNPQYARARLKELAERGVPEARLFLGQ